MRPGMVGIGFLGVLAWGAAASADDQRPSIVRVEAGEGHGASASSGGGSGFLFLRDGLRTPLDVELGAADGGYRAFASSADGGAIQAWFHPASNHWVVSDDSGLRRSFGTGAESRAGADVRRASGTRAWYLARVEDPSGNSLTLGPRGP